MSSVGWLVTLGLVAGAAHTITFDSASVGRMPSGWTASVAMPGASAKWQVVKDPTAPSPPFVLAEISREAAQGYTPIAVLNQPDLRDGEISVRFKAVAGREDRAAGLVWRYRDPNNYYLVRVNALANNVELCMVRNGKRTALMPRGRHTEDFSVDHPIPSNVWGTLKVVFRGPVFSVYLNHRRVILAEDATFQSQGKVGLWTERDSLTYFDDFQVAKRF